MNRRELLFGLPRIAGAGVVLFLSRKVYGALRCTPFAPNGVQQCESGIQSNMILSTALQQQSQWCWAACIEMVFRYYGFDVPQKRIVEETWGHAVNMPGSPAQIIGDLNRRWMDESGRGFSVAGDVYSVNAVTAAQDLAGDMPLIVGTMGHAVVLTSLVYLRNAYGGGQVTSAIVRDPWPGRGRRILTPQEWYGISFAARIRVSGT